MNFSLRFRGAVVLVLSAILEATGHEMPDAQLAEFVSTAGTIIGACMTLYGEWRAKGYPVPKFLKKGR